MLRHSQDSGSTRTVVIVAILVVATLGALVVVDRLRGDEKIDVKEALRRGDAEAAIRGLDRVLESDPGDEEALYYRGVCRIELRDTDDGLRDLALLSGSTRYRDLAFYREVEALLGANRVAEAKAAVESPADWRESSPLAREAIGLFHLSRANDAIEQAVKKIGEAKGDRRGEQLRSTLTRLVYADSKIHAQSLDRFQETLVSRYEYQEGAQLATIIDRGHRHLLTAVSELQEAIELGSRAGADPVPNARRELAEIYVVRGRMLEAEEQWSAITKIDPEALDADILRRNRVQAMRLQALLRRAESRLEARDHEGALEVAMEVPAARNGHRPRDVEWIIAQAYAGLGNSDKALEIANFWLRVSPKFDTPNLIVGRHLFEQGDHDRALPHLEVAKGNSVSNEAADLYIQCLLKLQRFDRATALLEQRLEGRGSDWEAFLLKVQAMEGMGWIDDARSELTKALGGVFSRPGTEANRRVRAFMEEFVARHDLLPRDLHTAQVLATEDPQNFDFGRRYLDLLLDAGAVEQAHRVADDLVDRCPPEDNAHYDVMMSAGRAYERLGRHTRAIACLESAQKDRPWSAEAHVATGRNQLALGNLGAAWRAVEKAELLAPEDLALHYLRFQLLEARGEEAAAIVAGAGLAEKGLRSFEFLGDLARLLLAAGKTEDAARVLALVPETELATPSRAIEHALLTLAAGGEADAKETIDRVIRTERFGTSRVVEIARRLQAIGRPDLVIEFLGPRVDGDAEIDPDAVQLLAAAYRETRADSDYLDMLARLRRQGRRARSYEGAAEFTFAKGAERETLSIVEAAVSEQAIDERILEIGVRQAVRSGQLDLARRYLGEFRKVRDSDPWLRLRLKALLLDADGSYLDAVKELEAAIEAAPPEARGPLWSDLVELQGRRGQLDAMRKSVTAAISRQECPPELAVLAARHVLAAGAPEAMAAIETGIAVAPTVPDGHLDRALLLLAQDEVEGALAAARRAFELRADSTTGHVLAVLLAISEDAEIFPFLNRNRGLLTVDSDALARFAWYLRKGQTATASEWLSRMSYPSWAEREALAQMVAGVVGKDDERSFLARKLPAFMLLMSGEQTVALSKRLANDFEEALPAFSRQARLLRARAMMNDPESFNEGIRLVARLLEESSMSDEAAFSIYAETYIRARRMDDLDRLIRYILQRPDNSDGFLVDLAGMLLGCDRAEDAARLAHLCRGDGEDIRRMQARTLFKAGHVARAAAIIESSRNRDQRDFLYCQIVGESLLADPKRLREGFEYLKEAVYRFPVEDPDVHVALARAAYRLGLRAEARKDIERFLAADPASARNVVIAFRVLEDVDQADAETLAYLQDRRGLLDPAGWFGSN